MKHFLWLAAIGSHQRVPLSKEEYDALQRAWDTLKDATPVARTLISITRRQVARQEIDTSIDLVLTEGSFVSAHLLAWAAIDVLRGVAEAQGTETFLARLEMHIRPEKIKMWRDVLRSHYTFAKHADRDPDRTIDDFNPDSTHLALLAAITDYGTLYKQLTMPMYLFRGWVLAHSPQLLLEGAAEEVIPGVEKMLGPDAPLEAMQALYREYKRDERFYLSGIPEERRPNVES